MSDIYLEANVFVLPFKFAVTLIRDCSYEDKRIVFDCPALFLRSFTWASWEKSLHHNFVTFFLWFSYFNTFLCIFLVCLSTFAG